MSVDSQAAFKARIKNWLEAPTRSRDWLSQKVGTSVKTVNNWLSSAQTIPQGKAQLIERLMADDAAAEQQRSLKLLPQAQIFSLEVDLPRFRAYSAAALASDKTLEQWAIEELNAAAAAATPEITERETEVAGQKLKIIGPTKYPARPDPNLRVAEHGITVNKNLPDKTPGTGPISLHQAAQEHQED